MRVIRHTLSNEGRDFGNQIALVPLSDKQDAKYAIVDEADLQFLIDNGCSESWNLNKNNQVVLWGGGGRTGRPCLVKRLITNAGAGQSVSPIDGNELNLRRINLAIGNCAIAKNNEWSFIRVNKRDARPRAIHKFEYRASGQHLSYVGQVPYYNTPAPTPLFSSRTLEFKD